jgi:hypothetical protein
VLCVVRAYQVKRLVCRKCAGDMAIGPNSVINTALITIGSETTFLSALCVLRRLTSRTSLLYAELTNFGDLGRCCGQNKAIVGVFNGPTV